MANDTYTNRFGQSIAVPEIKIPKDAMTSVMALRERYESKGKHYTLVGVVLDVLSAGVTAINHRLDYAEETKVKKQKADALDRLIRTSLRNGQLPSPEQVVEMAKGLGYSVPAEADSESELTEEQLEQATAPSSDAN